VPTQFLPRQAGATFVLCCTAACLLLTFSSCGGGGSASPANPWAGTYSNQFVLKGDTPDTFTGPDGDDPLIQAQIRQLLKDRTYELGLYSIANRTGFVQQLTVFNTPALSYLVAGEPAYAVPGAVSLLGDGLGRFELELSEPQYAWQTLAMRGVFDANKVNDLVMRIFPNRFQNIVAGDNVQIAWEITGMNGSRLVTVNCIQRAWLYSEPSSVH
jgi:hypothetical protein